MGAVHVTTAIRNPADPERFWEGLFLVDTGATDCLVPRCQLEAIGLVPKGRRTYELADGSLLRMDVTSADMEFMGDFTAGVIIFGDDNAEPVLGVTALESVGIEVDPLNQRLKRLPAVRLKSFSLPTLKQSVMKMTIGLRSKSCGETHGHHPHNNPSIRFQ